ncbi:hypothetical protein VTN02DRAFT_1903 [Thermoascus thermophilus]
MTSSRKRKTRTSRSLFSIWTPNKVVVVDGDLQPAPSRSLTSVSDIGMGQSTGKDGGIKGRFRRSSSKLLYMLGLRSTNASKIVHEQSDQNGTPDVVDGVQDSAPSSPPEECHVCQDTVPIPEIPSHLVLSPVDKTPHRRCSDRLIEALGTSAHEKHLKGQQIPETFLQSRDLLLPNDYKPQCGVRRSHSTPGLPYRFSRKLSTTFGHPTVIHRTSFRSRPSIPALEGPPPSLSALSKQGDNAQDSSDPSTTPSGSVSPSLRQSTNPTSEGASLSPEKAKRRSKSALERSKSFSLWNREPEKKLLPIEESPVASPSIVTVEATATAKIFFETHFNSIFSGVNPRAQRLRELEERLHSLPVSPEERMKARESWMAQESEYLRQSRVLKTRSNCVRHGETVSIAGYEVIKVLGKGSFGVVRLVKEKKEDDDDVPPIAANDGAPSPKNAPKPNTLDALRSAVDGTRSGRRRDLSKMKKEVFAMKVIRKSDMLRNSQEGHLRAERDFLVASEKSRWVVPLIASFQDTHNLYLVMDYMVGGDFLGLLIRKNILSEDVTRWYVAEMILCVEEAHRLQWIHRDVKPDNFLISASGHLKISDFGLAFDGHWAHDQAYFNNHRHSLLMKLGITIEGDAQDREEAKATGNTPPPTPPRQADDQKRKLAKSVVGTSQYMAPEVIRGELYDGRCDWWSIGIILYECLYGFTPFACENRQDTKLKILQHPRTLHFPAEKSSDKLVSAEAIDLISQLLQEKEYRLCSRKYMMNDFLHSKRSPGELINRPADRASRNYKGFYVYPDDAGDIKSHPFFRGIKWEEIHLRKPPFVPKVRNWEDTRYFEDEEQISDIDDGSSASDPPNAPPTPEPEDIDVVMMDAVDPNHAAQSPLQFPAPNKTMNSGSGQKLDVATKMPTKAYKKRKEKKRPRDKILRDETVGKTVLDIRKREAELCWLGRT